MDIYRKDSMATLVKDNAYVGRGIVIGKTADAKKQQWLTSSWVAAKTAVTVCSSKKATKSSSNPLMFPK